MRNWSIFRHLRTRRVAALLLAAGMMYSTLPVAYAQESTLTQQEIIAQVTSGSGVTSENDAESAESTSESQAAPESAAESAETASSSEAAPESAAESAEAASSSEAASESVAESTETASSSEAAPESVAESAETASSSEAVPESTAESSETASSSAITNEIKEESISQAENAAQTLQGEEMQEGNFVFYIDRNEEAQIVRYTGSISTGGKIVIPHLLGGKPVTGGDLQIPKNVTDLTVEFAQGTTTIFDICRGGKWLKKVILPSSVQVVGEYAFYNCENLEELKWGDETIKIEHLIFPEGLKEIGPSAFRGCKKISYVKFPTTLERDRGGFSDIPNLTAEFAEGTTEIAHGSLNGADGLKKVILPKSVQTISEYAFGGCTNLEEVSVAGAEVKYGQVILPEGLKVMEGSIFNYCEKISYVKFPMTLEKGNGAFYGVPNLTAEFAEGTTKVPVGVLNNADGLKKVILPGTVQIIGSGAFMNCRNLEEIEWGGETIKTERLIFPEGVTEIAVNAFNGCEKISYVKFPTTLEKGNYGAFSKIPDFTAEFSEGTIKVADQILNGATGLKKVILPSSVQVIGEYAFYNCENLEMIQWGELEVESGQLIIPEGVTEIDSSAFSGCKKISYVKFPTTLEKGNYDTFSKIPDFTAEFAEGITKVPDEILSQANGLKKAILPNTVQVIGDSAFINCRNLEEIQWGGETIKTERLIFPEGVTEIGVSSFNGCEKISYVKFPATLEEGHAAFSMIPNLTAEFAEGIIEAPRVLSHAEGLKKVILPNSVQVIGGNAFESCRNLEEISVAGADVKPGQAVLPEGLKTIGMNAFYACEALKQIVLPKDLTEIGGYAFSGCKNLSEIQVGNQSVKEGQAQMPAGLNRIEWGTFEGCTSLKELHCNGFLDYIEGGFRGCSNLNKVVVNEITGIAQGAFDNPNTVFYSTENSKAKEYAQQNNMGFEVLEIAPEKISFVKKQENLIMAENIPLYSAYMQEKVAVEGNPTFTTSIRFTSSNPQNVYFHNNLMYVKNQSGTTTVTAESGNTKDQCIIQVSLIKSANLNVSGLLLTQGQTFQLKLESDPKDAIPEKEVKWTGSYVDKNGLVTAPLDAVGSGTMRADFSGIQVVGSVYVVEDKNVVDSVSKLESDHNYTKDGVWTYTAKGLKNLQITFDSQTDMGDHYDELLLYDGQGKLIGRYRKDQLAGKSVVVPGDTVSIYLDDFNDGQQNGWGFKVTEIKEAPDQITSDEYPIDENKNISGIQPGASLESIQKDLVGQDIKVFDAKGKPVAANAPLGTGYVLTMGSFGDENQLTVVVSGDIDGDAKVAVSDTIYMKQTMMGSRVLEGAYQKAATFKSGSQEGPSVSDFTTMKQFMLGKISSLK